MRRGKRPLACLRCTPTDNETDTTAACAIKAYNAKAGMYAQVVQKRGQPLREGFTIVKVRAAGARFREL